MSKKDLNKSEKEFNEADLKNVSGGGGLFRKFKDWYHNRKKEKLEKEVNEMGNSPLVDNKD